MPGWIAIGCNLGTTILFKQKDKSHKLLQCADRKTQVVDIQWDRLSATYLLVAYQFFVALWDGETGEEIHCFEKQPLNITSIAWMEWTAGNFITTNGKNGNLKVWNASQKQALDTVKTRTTAGITSVVFSQGKPKALYACTDGSIAVYDVQNKKLDFRLSAGHTETIFACKFSPKSPNIFATASYDGTVKIWNLSDMSLTKTLYGNGDIIYSLDWSLHGNYVAASSYTGLVTLWDVDSGREIARYLNHTKPSFFVTWNPHDDRYLLSTSADGTVIVMELDLDQLQENVTVVKLGNRKKGVDSHKDNLSVAAIKMRYVHSAQIFGAAWSPNQPTVFCTCAQDGIVRVFNYEVRFTPMVLLVGHGARVFHCAWSPLLPGYLATSSDDQSILIWNVQSTALKEAPSPEAVTFGPLTKLLGHKGYVRALCWNYEHKNLLLSGSWDFSIRLWDIKSSTCLFELNEHIADVYAISSHPLRPFTYISASRDTTVRVWELEGIFTLMRYYAVWDGTCSRLISNAAEDSDRTRNKLLTFAESIKEFAKLPAHRMALSLPPVLCGAESKRLSENFGELKYDVNITGQDEGTAYIKYERNLPSNKLELAEKFYQIFSFFCGTSGYLDAWENAMICLSAKQRQSAMPKFLRPFAYRRILHESEILDVAKSDARKLHSSKASVKAESGNKSDEQVIAAAMLHMRLGEFEKYCTLMVELGKWESALAVAPAVSMEYWKQLSVRYAQHLVMQASEECIPFLLGTAKDGDAVEFYLNRCDFENALIVSKMSEAREDVIPDTSVSISKLRNTPQSQSGNSPMLSPLKASILDQDMSRQRTTNEHDNSRVLITSVAKHTANQHLMMAQPVFAAAQLLSVGDAQSALALLANNSEYDLAYALALCFDIDATEYLISWADRCASWHAIDLAVDMLETLPNAEVEIGLMLSKHCQESQAKIILSQRGYRTPVAWLSVAKEEEEIGSDSDSVVSYILGRHLPKAAAVGLDVLRRCATDPWDITPATKKLVRSLKYIRAEELDETTRLPFLCYMLWFTAHEAALKGMFSTSAQMLNVLLDFTNKIEFNISECSIQCQMMCFMLLAGEVSGKTLLQSMSNSTAVEYNPSVHDILRSIATLLRDDTRWNSYSLFARGLKASFSTSDSIGETSVDYSFASSLIR